MVSIARAVRTWPIAVLRWGALLPACPVKGRISRGHSDTPSRFIFGIARRADRRSEPIDAVRRRAKLAMAWPDGSGLWQARRQAPAGPVGCVERPRLLGTGPAGAATRPADLASRAGVPGLNSRASLGRLAERDLFSSPYLPSSNARRLDNREAYLGGSCNEVQV